ncbi:MAG TPA: hypothetical protein VJP86_06925, partial [Vicinamibacterales bacterium]|nr:hypothetical protein [Vicinamibacterales bacterium]
MQYDRCRKFLLQWALRGSKRPFFYAPGSGRQVGKDSERTNRRMLKVELHIHTGDDPVDRIGYSSLQVID